MKLALGSFLLLSRELDSLLFDQYYDVFLFGSSKNNLSKSASNWGEEKLPVIGSLHYSGLSSVRIVSLNFDSALSLSLSSYTQIPFPPIACWSLGDKFTFTVIIPLHSCYLLPPNPTAFSGYGGWDDPQHPPTPSSMDSQFDWSNCLLRCTLRMAGIPLTLGAPPFFSYLKWQVAKKWIPT